MRSKDRAKYLGADLVGVTTVKEDFTYSDGFSYEESKLEKGPAVTTPVDLKHKYLVVLGREMSYPVIKNAPTDTENAGLGEIGKSYYDVALVACTLAAHIRTLGYSARAHHLRNDQIMHVPHAVDAGLGEQGRHSYLMTAEYGPRVRLAAVSHGHGTRGRQAGGYRGAGLLRTLPALRDQLSLWCPTG